jgi:hypothetical protein
MRRNAVERTPAGQLIVSSASVPGDAEMASYRRRLSAIEAGLKNNSLAALIRRMARLFLLFPVTGQAAGMGESTAEAYASVLSAVPIWAVDKACIKIVNSGAKFRPSAPEILKLAVENCRFAHDEADTLRAILAAEPYQQNDPTERDRVKNGFAELLRHIVGDNAMKAAKGAPECAGQAA